VVFSFVVLPDELLGTSGVLEEDAAVGVDEVERGFVELALGDRGAGNFEDGAEAGVEAEVPLLFVLAVKVGVAGVLAGLEGAVLAAGFVGGAYLLGVVGAVAPLSCGW